MTTIHHRTCPTCQVGRLREKTVTYTHVYSGTLVSVPNMPALECDFCLAIEYDRRAILRLEALIGQAGPRRIAPGSV